VRLSRLNTAQFETRTRKIARFRRRAWAPRRVHTAAPRMPEVAITHEYIRGEYEEPPKSKVLAAARRGIGLMSDLIVLTIASPFFAVWFLYRGILRLTRGHR
jgi:hypothetical protein